MIDVTAKIQIEQETTLVPAYLEVRLDDGGGRVEFAPASIPKPTSEHFVASESLQLTPEVAAAILANPDVQALILALKQKANPSVQISSDIPKTVKDAAIAEVAAMVAAEAALAEEVTP